MQHVSVVAHRQVEVLNGVGVLDHRAGFVL